MGRQPRITGRDLLRALVRSGYEVARQRGSHVQVRKFVEGRKVTFPVPVHSGKLVKPGTLHIILRLAGMSVEDLERLL